MNTVLEVLNAMDDKFSTPETWTQRAFARDSEGSSVWEFSREATCWCVSGCLMMLTEVDRSGILNQIGADVRSLLERQTLVSIPKWNDREERTFQDVKDLLAAAKLAAQAP